MNFNFDNKINNFLKIILKNAQIKKIRVFFVGGVVRDNVLGISETNLFDVDLLVEGNAVEFVQGLDKTVVIKSVHKDFCTVKVEYEGLVFDIASTREEEYPFSGCLPVVKKTGVKLLDDVKRRDFGVNSLYCELKLVDDKIQFELIDLVNGVEDIKNKTLKALHDKSYIDDPTRILRGIGFKHRFNFDFSCYDKKLISEYLCDIDYSNISYERTKSVLKKILALNTSDYDSVFQEIIEKKYYKILFNKDLKVDFNKIRAVLTVFRNEKINFGEFYFLVIENNPVKKIQNTGYSKLFKTFALMETYFLAYYFYKTNDENILLYLNNKNLKLFVSGDDLINLGFEEGKLLGEIFEKLFCAKLFSSDEFLSKNDEISWIRSNF